MKLTDLPGLDPELATHLSALGITTIEGLAAAPVETLLTVRGVSTERAERLRAAARAASEPPDETTRGAVPADAAADGGLDGEVTEPPAPLGEAAKPREKD
ncbi:helix-hairpin-helix domain-containing protein [Wenxinia marina]|uniref:Helix-hairpin-helix domain protein n=1 Tax=Wenxinia marina DSM 24838 TaxID=1123501 RepID=A0A0D0QC76_9RHOB|nr:helix-hairpin-helix domain-containing protein [Wenxinia marina]KIQ68553.1 hypothetical protein Wenmar_02824 [Wenxinia marina DSM 24838]GGL66835.1 hypothetical protein GCM10011392_21670 [Wenxinia marina]